MTEPQGPDLDRFLTELKDPDWVTRQAAASSLRALGKQAVPALSDLRLALEDGDYDVREAALRAIRSIEPDQRRLINDLLARISDPIPQVRTCAVEGLSELTDLRPEATDALWQALAGEEAPSVRDALVNALRTLVADLGGEGLERLQSGNSSQIVSGIAVLLHASPTSVDGEQLTSAARGALQVLDRRDSIVELGWLLSKYATQDAIEQIIFEETGLPPWKRCLLIVWDYAYPLVGELVRKRPDDVVQLVLTSLSSADSETFNASVALLRQHGLGTRLEPPQRDALEQLMLRAAQQGVGIQNLSLLGKPSDVLKKVLESGSLTPSLVEALLLSASDLIDEAWPELRSTLLGVLSAGLDHSSWVVRQRAAELLRQHARDVARDDQARGIAQQLERLASTDGDADVQRAAQLALTELRQEERSTRIPKLVSILRTGDDSARIEIAHEILEDPTPEATRALAREFAIWIAFGTGQVVEVTGDAIRRSSAMVLPLLDQWERGLEVDEYVRDRLVQNVVPHDIQATANTLLKGNTVSRPELNELEEWLAEDEPVSSVTTPPQDETRSRVRETKRRLSQRTLEELQPRLDKERRRRALAIRRTFARLLADMSDERFFEESERPSFEAITGQLRRHAVRILGRRLATEQDITTRESIARTLAGLGGREAVDALTRAIVDDERTRANRQDLLARYYLEPSKTRSDEAAQILHGAVSAAKRTLTLLQALNVLFFLVALILIAGGAVLAFTGGDTAEVVGGGVAGLSGVVAVVIQVLRQPLAGIQNAVTRLVQVETAFASFIWELNLNGTYIQSQYVAEGILTDDHIRLTVERIENAMHLAMSLVARYVEEDAVPMMPRLTTVSPSFAYGGSSIVVLGRALKAGTRNGHSQVSVAIDHLPIPISTSASADDRIEFTLPGHLSSTTGETKTVWVSAVVEGLESNALPLMVMPRGSDGLGASRPDARENQNQAALVE